LGAKINIIFHKKERLWQKVKIVTLFVKLIYRKFAVPLHPVRNWLRRCSRSAQLKQVWFCARLIASLPHKIKNKNEIKKYHHSRYGIARIYGMQRHKATTNGIINI